MNKAAMTASIDHLFSTPSHNGRIPIGKVAIPYRALAAKVFQTQPTIEKEIYISKEDLWQFAKHECIEEKCFDWIDIRNDRMCNFLWSTIRIANPYDYDVLPINHLDIFKEQISSYGPRAPLYERLSYLDKKPRGNDIKIKIFKYFFDISNLLSEQKLHELNRVRDAWNLCTRNNDMLKWFGDMSSVDCMNKCNWAWDYTCKRYKVSSTRWFINNDNKKDLYNGMITMFDLLQCDASARELFKRDIKRAWSQKDYRDKNNGKKAVSIVLSEKTIEMLNMICADTDERKNEVMSRLIKDEYNKIKTSGR